MNESIFFYCNFFQNIPSLHNSPTSVSGNLLQYFSTKRKTNDMVVERKVHKPSLVQLQMGRTGNNKRDRDVFLKISTNAFPCITSSNDGSKNTSPRLLQPPSWLLSNPPTNNVSNKYASGHTKPALISGKRITDWKSISSKSSHEIPEFLLPSCAGSESSRILKV
jgi:hypothetical protein